MIELEDKIISFAKLMKDPFFISVTLETIEERFRWLGEVEATEIRS